MEPDGVVVVLMTRWHLDDLVGRLQREPPDDDDGQDSVEQWQVVDLPAIAGTGDPLGRAPGEPLWPERFPLYRLERRRQLLGSYWWSALYQQQPNPEGGELVRREWLHVVDAAPAGLRPIRAWDLAATAARQSADPDWTAGALLDVDRDGRIWLLDMRRFRGSPAEVERVIAGTAEQDGREVGIWFEQEPGASGKSVVDQYQRRVLPGYSVRAVAASSRGSKLDLWDPLIAQMEAGNVYLVRGAWNEAFLAEAEQVPSGGHDDQMDAAATAYHVRTGSAQRAATGHRAASAGDAIEALKLMVDRAKSGVV